MKASFSRARRCALLACAAWAMLAPQYASAGPMGFKDSWMAMGDLGSNWREVFVNQALTPRDAVGAGLLWMRADDQSRSRSRSLAEASYTRLLARWNLPQAQANIWFVGGLGAVRGSDFAGTRLMATPGVQLDYETTRLYLSANARLFRAEGLNHDYGSLRAGFSFYEVDYEQVQPWFVIEARRMRGLSARTEITPMLRLIERRYFVELGINQAAEARANFMFIF